MQNMPESFLLKQAKLQQEIEDEKYVRKQSKPCPSCGAAIDKIGGCNKVVCPMCKGRMCWVCETGIDGYEHFQRGGCRLMDLGQMVEWQEQWERLVAEQQAMAPPAPDLAGRLLEVADVGVRCPQCRSWCPKVARNNHLKCLLCQTDFCFLCQEVLRGRASVKNHFNCKRCPQHS